MINLWNRLGRQTIVALLLMSVTCLAWGSEQAVKADEALYQNPARHSELLILQQKLQDDMDLLQFSRNHLENLKKTADSVDPAQAEEARFNVELADVQVQKINLELSASQKNIPLLENMIGQFEQQLIHARTQHAEPLVQALQDRVSLERQKLSVEKERVKTLTQLLSQAKEIRSLEEDKLSRTTEKLRLEEVASLWKDQQAHETKLLALQKDWESKLIQARQDLDKKRPLQSPPTVQQQALLDQITEADEYMQLYQVQLTLSRIDTLLDALDKRDIGGSEASYGHADLIERLNNLRDELRGSAAMVHNKESLLQRQLAVMKQPGAKHVLVPESKARLTELYTVLKTEYAGTDQAISSLQARLDAFQHHILTGARQSWQTRQQLPRDLAGWKQFGSDLWTLPHMAFQSLVTTYDQVVDNLSTASTLIWTLLLILISGWTALCLWSKRRLTGFLSGARDKGMSFSANAFIIVAQLVYRNIPGIVLFGSFLIVLFLLQISSNNMVALISLGAVWFFYRTTTGLARISLFENIWDLSGSDVKLYQGLRWSLGLGSFIIALTVLAHTLPLSTDIVASFDRLFMLVLLGVSVPLLRSWNVLPSLIAKEGKTKLYVRRMAHWLGFLIPLTLFSNAVIGLIGYVNLAWLIWIAEGQFLLVLTALVLARGLLGDTMEALAKSVIRNLKSGWVWTEALLKPLHKVFQLLIYFAAGLMLFRIYGLDRHPLIMEHLDRLFTKPLIEASGVSITVLSIVQFIILLMVIRWAAKWSREFAYRFIFAKTKDKGLRNSLAVFTQYATVILGAFVVLKVIGIDLTTLTVVLGALAVGIGFGLQGIANNMVSGILLLIERPFRAGDIITLGTHEGEVTHIGVRATTIKTWDNLDVIIPNAETVSQALTNWTHHDSIVRTTFDLNIGYQENPYQTQAIVMQVLRRHKGVVSFPEPSVLFMDFAEYSLKFQVRYYIDLSAGKSRTEIRSEVLFAIWDSLRAAGIDIPYPRQSIELINKPGS
jgi:potassium efflux system protein